MLGAVVVSFFVCLLPFRLLTLINMDILNSMTEDEINILLNLCRVMIYLNSAVNPILYNLMSSKFRAGFLRLFGLRTSMARQGTYSSSTTNTHTTSMRSSSHGPHPNTPPSAVVFPSVSGPLALGSRTGRRVPPSLRRPQPQQV